jgi:hypothetical protein
MSRNLGAFSCYGIEYVFDFLGEEKINSQIHYLESTSTGSFGITLRDFTFNEADSMYFSGNGVLWVFSLLMEWFNEIQFDIFLYQSSRNYHELTYYSNNILRTKWLDHLKIENHISIVTKNIDPKQAEVNSYWTDYHFFYMTLSKHIIQELQKKKNDFNIIGSYTVNKNKLFGNILLEIKTRRKPLTGQYLMYREAFVWYNLELKELTKNTSIYQFSKDNNLYNLIVDQNASKARIELSESLSNEENNTRPISKIDLENIWSKIIDDYTINLSKISSAIRVTTATFSNERITNGVMRDIYEYYIQQKEYNKAKTIAELNNTHLDVWAEIPEDFEE